MARTESSTFYALISIPKCDSSLRSGAADGFENCSAWLAFAHAFGGVMVEGDPALSAACHSAGGGAGLECVACRGDGRLLERRWNHETVPVSKPDVFVIDIDGIDFHVLQSVLDLGSVRKSSSWNTTAHLALSKRSRFHTNHVSKGFKLILRDCITVHPLPRGAR